MIDLSSATVVGEGAQRRAYIHPEDDSYLLKVQVRPFEAWRHWYDRPLKVPSSNDREILGWANVARMLGRHERFLSRVLGLENTSEGPALLVENAACGAAEAMSLKDINGSRGRGLGFSADDLRWAKGEYRRIVALFEAKRIYNHCLRQESVLLCRCGAGLSLRLIDYKAMIYRQFVSPRYVPGARMAIQRKTTRSVEYKLATVITRLERGD